VPICHLPELVGTVRDRIDTTGWGLCVVVNDQRVVLGLLGVEELNADPRNLVEEVMREGPQSFRASRKLEDSIDYMRQYQVDSVLVTTPDGELIGALKRYDAERAVEAGQSSSKHGGGS
jgi:Mg/Co/Ni transporter MgtE